MARGWERGGQRPHGRRSRRSSPRTGRPQPPRLIPLVALALTLALGLAPRPAVRGLAAPLARGESRAAGHAEVVAQGLALMPRVSVGWRVVSMAAQPLASAPVTPRSLGFVLAGDGPVLVADQTTGTRTLLQPGEATLAQQDARQQRASTTDQPVTYSALELVVADSLRDPATIGSGQLRFASELFPAPAAERDLSLVRDVLNQGERGSLAGTDAPVLALVTAGSVQISGSGSGQTLRAGSAALFGGALTVIGQADGSVIVFAVIGERAPAAPTRPTTAAAVPTTIAPTAAATGSFAVQTYACPAGATIGTFDPATCAPSGNNLAAWQLSSDQFTGSGTLTMADAAVSGDTTTWGGLPAGTYFLFLMPVQFADGYDNYFVPSSDQVTRQADGSTKIFFDSAQSGAYGPTRAYFFPSVADTPTVPAVAETGAVTMTTSSCPPGTVLADIQVTPCAPAPTGFAVTLSGLAGSFGLADARQGSAGIAWLNVPAGDYVLRFTSLPDRHDTVYVFDDAGLSSNVQMLGDGGGFAFSLADGQTRSLTALFVDSASS